MVMMMIWGETNESVGTFPGVGWCRPGIGPDGSGALLLLQTKFYHSMDSEYKPTVINNRAEPPPLPRRRLPTAHLLPAVFCLPPGGSWGRSDKVIHSTARSKGNIDERIHLPFVSMKKL